MESHVTATEAARSLSDLFNRTRYRGESFVVERGGEAICRIVPARPPKRTVRDLVALLKTSPKPDAAYLDAVERIAREQPALPKSPWER